MMEATKPELTDEEIGRCVRERRFTDVRVAVDCPGHQIVMCYVDGHDVWARQVHPSFSPVLFGCGIPKMDGLLTQVTENLDPLIAAVLERADQHDLGDGWVISKTSPGHWHLYYRAKHIDCWITELNGTPLPMGDSLAFFESAAKAIAGFADCQSLRNRITTFADRRKA